MCIYIYIYIYIGVCVCVHAVTTDDAVCVCLCMGVLCVCDAIDARGALCEVQCIILSIPAVGAKVQYCHKYMYNASCAF